MEFALWESFLFVEDIEELFSFYVLAFTATITVWQKANRRFLRISMTKE